MSRVKRQILQWFKKQYCQIQLLKFIKFYKPVLEELQVLLTEFAQAFQKASFFMVGHLSVQASSQNKQMCCTRAEISCADHSLGPTDFGAGFVSGKRLFLEDPCTGTRLQAGLPGVFPSETIGLL